jgi:cytochrome c556
VLLASLLLAVTACGQSADRTAVARESAVGAPDTLAHLADSGAGHAAAGEGGQALLPIMQRLGSEMTALTYGLMTDDHEAVMRSAAAIAEHAPISAADLERIHTVLGPDMARFEAVDDSVHVASTRLHDAAQAREPDVVVQRLGEVQRGCVSCHVQFRERLRTNAKR